MNKIVSEDAVRRAFAAIDEDDGAVWLRRHLDYCTAPLLAEPWILDIDTTVKPLYGHQEGAVIGYNPKKPGRPSHSYHTYSMAGVRLVLDVDVVAGNEHTSKHFAPGLWALLDRIPRDLWPSLLRGDCGFGNEPIMREAEQRGLAYLFKLRLLLLTGARVNEVLQARWDWVDWDRKCIVPPDSNTGSKPIFLSDPTLAVLRDLSARPEAATGGFIIKGRLPGKNRS